MSTLTAPQRAIVDAPADARVLVTAGPGTGKTHVLIERLAKLVDRDDLAPGSEILLLTFTRAAVGELKRRVRRAGGDVAFVRAATFDSFATGILRRHLPGGSWSELGYDGRIDRAVELLRTDSRARSEVERYRHVLVDELQDVVGVRDQLLRELLSGYAGGWTLLGDPAQGIYNFQLSDAHERRRGSAALYGWVRSTFPSASEFTLEENHRALDERATVALFAGRELNCPSPNYPAVRRALRDRFDGLQSGPPAERLHVLEGRVGILCPTNGQALLVSRSLWEAGVDHRLRRAATDRGLPAWLATLISDAGLTIEREEFEERAAVLFSDEGSDLDEVWRALRRAADVRRGPVGVAALVDGLRSGRVPDELASVPEAAITVSTIHRSKGLEYDHVLMIDPDRSGDGDDDVAEEARLAYVGMTRARRRLLRWPTPPSMTGMSSGTGDGERWSRKGPVGPKRRYLLRAIELRPDDTADDRPPGSESSEGAPSPSEIRRHLELSIRIGDEVELIRQARMGPGDVPLYEVRHTGMPVGLTNEAFGAALRRAMGFRRVTRWPLAIAKVRVEGLETRVGSTAATEAAGLGAHGVWLGVRLAGLGELEF